MKTNLTQPSFKRFAEYLANYIEANQYDIVDDFMDTEYPDESLTVDIVSSNEYAEIERKVHRFRKQIIRNLKENY